MQLDLTDYANRNGSLCSERLERALVACVEIGDRLEVLLRDPGYRNVRDVDLLFPDQVKEEIERADEIRAAYFLDMRYALDDGQLLATAGWGPGADGKDGFVVQLWNVEALRAAARAETP